MKVYLFSFGDGHDYYAMFCSISWVHQYGPLLQTISTQKDLHYLAYTRWSDSSVETKGVLSHLVHDIWPLASEQQHFWCVFKGLKLIVAEVCSNLWRTLLLLLWCACKMLALDGCSGNISHPRCCYVLLMICFAPGQEMCQGFCEEGVTNKIIARSCRAVFKGCWLVIKALWEISSTGHPLLTCTAP